MSSTVNPKRHSLNITPGARPLHLLNETQSEPPSSPSPPPPRRQSTISYRDVERRNREPLTLTEKHADLLHFIAQKESKCLELRSQLAVHEAELLQLKRKWERIVSRGFEKQQQIPSPSPSSSSSSSTTTLATPPPQQSAPTSPSLPPDTRDSGATPLISPAPDFSSWLSNVGVPNLPKKWDVPALSKRASLFGQSIAQALDLSPPPSTTRPLTGKSGRHSHSSSTPLASLSLLSTPSRPSPSLPAKVPEVMSHSHSSSTPSSPSPLSANTPLPTPPPTTAEEMNPTKPMSLARTPEEEEDDAWNW
ncbi:hypothetical protein EDD18DRAFT_1229824 [Armillaria luteobubalina]|uniref:Uncharacterized protein n=1 Tax=Armillaria luteobubalina TaxID=153913 RepID=A0AA39UBK0_9AGAR|nr:hypothetical protein EDD18DRAFT_1229824 [Armillaria luteobubalina]